MRSVLAIASALLLCSCGSSSSTPGAPTEGGTDGEITTDDGGSLDAPLGPDQTADGAPSPEGSADSPNDTAQDAAQDGSTPADSGSCFAPTDCRLYSSYCGGCACLPLPAAAPNPTCDAGTVSCLRDPCTGQYPTCTNTGTCTSY
jgi:hypothetical protein